MSLQNVRYSLLRYTFPALTNAGKVKDGTREGKPNSEHTGDPPRFVKDGRRRARHHLPSQYSGKEKNLKSVLT